MKAPMRAFGWSLTLAALLCTASCDKGKPTTTPGGTSGPAAAGATVLRYKAGPLKLLQTGSFDMNTTGGGQFGEAVLRYTAAVDFQPTGEKIKVVWALSDIASLEAKGMFSDPAGDDAKALLVSDGKGAFIVDLRGQLDEAATEKLAENTARRERFAKFDADAKAAGGEVKGGGALRLLALTDSMIALPDLPEAALAVGKTVVVEEEEEAQMSGIVLPSETETKYTLVKIDDSGSSRIAEIQIEAVTGGATEVPGGMLTVDMTTEGTMLFDIDAGLPVRYQLTRSQSFSFGDNAFESTIVVEATFAPA